MRRPLLNAMRQLLRQLDSSFCTTQQAAGIAGHSPPASMLATTTQRILETCPPASASAICRLLSTPSTTDLSSCARKQCASLLVLPAQGTCSIRHLSSSPVKDGRVQQHSFWDVDESTAEQRLGSSSDTPTAPGASTTGISAPHGAEGTAAGAAVVDAQRAVAEGHGTAGMTVGSPGLASASADSTAGITAGAAAVDAQRTVAEGHGTAHGAPGPASASAGSTDEITAVAAAVNVQHAISEGHGTAGMTAGDPRPVAAAANSAEAEQPSTAAQMQMPTSGGAGSLERATAGTAAQGDTPIHAAAGSSEGVQAGTSAGQQSPMSAGAGSWEGLQAGTLAGHQSSMSAGAGSTEGVQAGTSAGQQSPMSAGAGSLEGVQAGTSAGQRSPTSTGAGSSEGVPEALQQATSNVHGRAKPATTSNDTGDGKKQRRERSPNVKWTATAPPGSNPILVSPRSDVAKTAGAILHNLDKAPEVAMYCSGERAAVTAIQVLNLAQKIVVGSTAGRQLLAVQPSTRPQLRLTAAVFAFTIARVSRVDGEPDTLVSKVSKQTQYGQLARFVAACVSPAGGSVMLDGGPGTMVTALQAIVIARRVLKDAGRDACFVGPFHVPEEGRNIYRCVVIGMSRGADLSSVSPQVLLPERKAAVTAGTA